MNLQPLLGWRYAPCGTSFKLDSTAQQVLNREGLSQHNDWDDFVAITRLIESTEQTTTSKPTFRRSRHDHINR